MEISIDESGTFVNKGAKEGSWCVVTAFVMPEIEKRNVREALRQLKVKSGFVYNQEIKLYQLDEQRYFEFIQKLTKTTCTVFSVATDSYFNDDIVVSAHRDAQVRGVANGIPSMKYQGGKDALKLLSEQLKSVSPQLYSQLTCQILLMRAFLERSINYYVQRQPKTLRCFKWRVDGKQMKHKTDFEDAFEKYAPGLLQTFSLEKPVAILDWCDYSSMSEFIYEAGDIPNYLVERFPHLANETALDIQKIIRKDIEFVDSRYDVGIQIADLLASGLRRLLRAEYADNEKAASLLGSLFVQAPEQELPIKLVSFSGNNYFCGVTADLLSILTKNSRQMLAGG
ncbi:DUF3800 domain-containing protein [Rheinheimera pacifica]|uniref:DUF3800 domain-containing protein n=1 Tax=Rheinheimera pacifica TaxID=173990 RepID=UPI002EDB5BCB